MFVCVELKKHPIWWKWFYRASRVRCIFSQIPWNSTYFMVIARYLDLQVTKLKLLRLAQWEMKHRNSTVLLFSCVNYLLCISAAFLFIGFLILYSLYFIFLSIHRQFHFFQILKKSYSTCIIFLFLKCSWN